MTHDSPNETDRLQQDLRQMFNQCDALFAGAMQQERKNVDNLRSAFLMMGDMGYTAEEAKDEFTRFQAQYNAHVSSDQDPQPLRQRVDSACLRPINKCGMSGVQSNIHVMPGR